MKSNEHGATNVNAKKKKNKKKTGEWENFCENQVCYIWFIADDDNDRLQLLQVYEIIYIFTHFAID